MEPALEVNLQHFRRCVDVNLTGALILSQLDGAQASGILAQLPERLQSDVAYRIATMDNITPSVIKQIYSPALIQ